jgi:hypothetical protein
MRRSSPYICFAIAFVADDTIWVVDAFVTLQDPAIEYLRSITINRRGVHPRILRCLSTNYAFLLVNGP